MNLGNYVFNARCLGGPNTGVQRYARVMYEGLALAGSRPRAFGSGSLGHLWEQTVLPVEARGRLLFSPGNTGPLGYENQALVVHDASTLDHPEWFSGKFAKWYGFLLPRLIRSVRRVITVSEFSRDRILAHVPEARGKVNVVYNGIDLATFCSGENQMLENMRTRRTRYVLCVGSIEPRKNLKGLVEAWRSIDTAGHELWIAGGGLGRVFSALDLPENVPGVRMLGRVSDTELGRLYREARGFVFPSLYEGFGLPPLEALASGCPVALSDAGSLPEIGGEADERDASGLPAVQYFDPLDIAQIGESLSAMIGASDEERQRVKEPARARAARFTWGNAIMDTKRILGELSNDR